MRQKRTGTLPRDCSFFVFAIRLHFAKIGGFPPLGRQKVANKKTFPHLIDNHYLECYTDLGHKKRKEIFMKKLTALLLASNLMLSMTSCDFMKHFNDLKSKDPNIDITDEKEDHDEINTDESTEMVEGSKYYKIEKLLLSTVRYSIYDSNGTVVLCEETDRPLKISMLGEDIVDISIGWGTGIIVHKYYDVQNNRFSEEYSYVAASSGNLVAYIEGSSLSDRALVVRDIFDESVFYKSFSLDFLSTEHHPIESATFTDGEAELNLVYLSEGFPIPLSVTLPIRHESNEGEILSSNLIAMQMYEAAIRGEICVMDERLCEIKLTDRRFPSNNLRLGGCEILYQAILDMDGDGISEYVIQSEAGDHIVLHYDQGKVYSYCFDRKSLFNLNTDGSFYWIDSDDLNNCTRGYNQIAFDGSSLRINELYRIKQTSPHDYGDGDHEYYVDGKQITRDEFWNYYDSNCRGAKLAIFSPLDLSCNYPISSEKACELASKYWGVESGMSEGAAGTYYVSKIVILKKPNPASKYYRIGWQAEGYSTHVIDGYYAQPPRSVRIYGELYIDAVTGACWEDDGETDELTPSSPEAKTAMEMYEAAIKGEICVMDERLCELSLKDCRFPGSDLRLEEYQLLSKAILDMDGDGINEYVIQSPTGEHILLRYYDGKVYCYGFAADDFCNLNEDGTFYSRSYEYEGVWYGGYHRLSFEGTFLNVEELCRVEETSKSWERNYYLNGCEVTYDEFRAYYYSSEYAHWRWISFSPFELSCQHPISAELAMEIAREYVGEGKGNYDAACGTTLYRRVLISSVPTADNPYYHIVFYIESYYHGELLWECGMPNHIGVRKEVLVNAYTGACYPDSASDGK